MSENLEENSPFTKQYNNIKKWKNMTNEWVKNNELEAPSENN